LSRLIPLGLRKPSKSPLFSHSSAIKLFWTTPLDKSPKSKETRVIPRISVSHQVTNRKVQQWRIACAILFVITSLVTVGTAQKPQAALPRVRIGTTWNPPTGGTTWSAHTSAQLTSALASAAPGDIIVLDAGVIYTGNFVVPAKSNAINKWI